MSLPCLYLQFNYQVLFPQILWLHCFRDINCTAKRLVKEDTLPISGSIGCRGTHGQDSSIHIQPGGGILINPDPYGSGFICVQRSINDSCTINITLHKTGVFIVGYF